MERQKGSHNAKNAPDDKELEYVATVDYRFTKIGR